MSGTRKRLNHERKYRKRNSLAGVLFCSPWIVGFLLLFLWPFAASLYWSLCRFDLINPPEFIGLENYQTLLDEIASGKGFGTALANTTYYCLISVPLSVVLGIGLAVLLNLKTARTSGLSHACFSTQRNSDRGRQRVVGLAVGPG